MTFLLLFFLTAMAVSAISLYRRNLRKELIVLACVGLTLISFYLFIILGGSLPYVGTAMNRFFHRLLPLLFKL